MTRESGNGLIKIGELAKASGTNVSTIKFYIKEGLLQAACKTGRNMAYYHPDAVARVQLIRSLQKEHYYPLSVIKHMLKASVPSQTELRLLDAIHKVDYRSARRTYSLVEAGKLTRLTREQIALLREKNLVCAGDGGKKAAFSETDLQVMLLSRRRMDAGIPFDQTVYTFADYAKALRAVAGRDVDSFISQALLPSGAAAEEAARMIGVSDETLDKFIGLKRSEFNRAFGAERIADLDTFSARLAALLGRIGDAMAALGREELAARCREALSLPPDGVAPLSDGLRFYHFVIVCSSESLAKSISLCGQAHGFFSALPPEPAERAETLLLYTLRLGWLRLTPSLLHDPDGARRASEEFPVLAERCAGPRAEAYINEIESAIAQTGG